MNKEKVIEDPSQKGDSKEIKVKGKRANDSREGVWKARQQIDNSNKQQ